jgi:MFS family permease
VPPSISPWRALRRPQYAAWSAANLLSNVGTWLQLVAQNVLVFQLTGSAALAGVCATASAAPALLLSPVGGALVDRYSKRLVAGVSQTGLALVAAVTAVLAWHDALTPSVLIALALTAGSVAAIDGPAMALLGNDLVDPEDVPSAVSVGSVITTVGRVTGAALAGVVLATGGAAVAYAANAVSFLVVTGLIALLRIPPVAAPAPASRSVTGDLLGGLRWLTGRPALLLLATVSGLATLLSRNYGLVLAPLTLTALGAGGSGYGAVNVALGVGATLGAVLAGRMRTPRVRLAIGLAVAGAAVQLGISASPTLGVLLGGAVLMAALESVAATASATLLMTQPPEEVRGRVLGAWGTLSTACGMTGPILCGALLSVFGPRLGLVAGATVFLAAVLVVLQAYVLRVHGEGLRGWRVPLGLSPATA